MQMATVPRAMALDDANELALRAFMAQTGRGGGRAHRAGIPEVPDAPMVPGVGVATPFGPIFELSWDAASWGPQSWGLSGPSSSLSWASLRPLSERSWDLLGMPFEVRL